MVFSDCGHKAGEPRAVLVQSSARMRCPISPPPARKSRGEIEAPCPIGTAGLLSEPESIVLSRESESIFLVSGYRTIFGSSTTEFAAQRRTSPTRLGRLP